MTETTIKTLRVFYSNMNNIVILPRKIMQNLLGPQTTHIIVKLDKDGKIIIEPIGRQLSRPSPSHRKPSADSKYCLRLK